MRIATSIAEHFGSDIADIRDCKYQPTRTPHVYVIGDDYYTACNLNTKPKKFEGYLWVRQESWIRERFGWEVYKAFNL